jgi:hypothetical protein
VAEVEDFAEMSLFEDKISDAAGDGKSQLRVLVD